MRLRTALTCKHHIHNRCLPFRYSYRVNRGISIREEVRHYSDSGRHGHAGQVLALPKGVFTNVRDAMRDRHRKHPPIVVKRLPADGLHAGREHDGLKRRAPRKRPISDRSYPTANRNCLHVRAVLKRIAANGHD